MTLKKLTIQQNQKGFTLIELMIVIAIIGILAAIAIPNFISYRNKSFCSAAESDAQAVAAGIADYFAIPTHTAIDDASYKVWRATTTLTGGNTFTISAAAPNTVITVTVTDASGRCPTEYQTSNADTLAANNGNGWDGAYNYTKLIQQ